MDIPDYKIGLFGIGLDTYWEQFEGLKPRLEGYLSSVESKIKKKHRNVLNLGLIDNIDSAFEAGVNFRKQNVDIIFLYVTTYALSSTVLTVVQKSRVPVVVLNLSPEAAINYTTFNQLKDRKSRTGEWLAHCSACPVPEISNVFKRTGIPFHEVTGILNDQSTWSEIDEWIEAGRVSHTMSFNRLGCVGHYYGGMLDIYTDLTKQYAYFGGHIEIIEVDEISSLRKKVTSEEVDYKIKEFEKAFEIREDCKADELKRAAITSVAVDKLVEKYSLGSLAYYYKGTGVSENEDTLSSLILGTSLLTAKNIPVAGEYEIKNVQAMKIMSSFGAGGSFTEYYAMDYNDDVVLMGHDGPGHIAIAEGAVRVKPLEVYHGKVGKGLSIEMSVKNGEVTLLSVVETIDNRLMFLIAEGHSVSGPVLEIGNTNSRYRFPIGCREFVHSWNSHGPAHHCAVGVGHIGSKIEKLGKLLNIVVVQVC